MVLLGQRAGNILLQALHFGQGLGEPPGSASSRGFLRRGSWSCALAERVTFRQT